MAVLHLSRVARKPVFSDLARHKPGCTARGLKFGFRKERDCTVFAAKTKALICCAVTAQLICVFVFVCAKSDFSHEADHITSQLSCSLTLIFMVMFVSSSDNESGYDKQVFTFQKHPQFQYLHV